MLKSAYIVFPATVSLEDLKNVLKKADADFIEDEKLKWIATISPDRHVRLNIVNINEDLDLERDEMNPLVQKFGVISTTGIFVEMSSSEKEGKLAVQIVSQIVKEVGGMLIDHNGKQYSANELIEMARSRKGLYG